MAICVAFIPNPTYGGPTYSMSTFVLILFSISIVITVLGTSLIVFRILSVTQGNASVPNTRTYKKIQRILIESGVIYTISMVITGIVLIIIQVVTLEASQFAPFEVLTYSQAFVTPLSVCLLFYLVVVLMFKFILARELHLP